MKIADLISKTGLVRICRSSTIALGVALGSSSCNTTSQLTLTTRTSTRPVIARLTNMTGLSPSLSYGHWGGPGNTGGEPIDAMDELFRRHDIVYYAGKSLGTLRRSDELLVAQLQRLDPTALSDRGRKYRRKAIRFFESPISKVVGKPPAKFLRRREPKNSPFGNQNDLERFFRAPNAKNGK